MTRLSLITLVFALLAQSVFALSNHAARSPDHDKLARAHGVVNITERGSASQSDWKLKKRFDGARCTEYVAGLGACGQTNTGSDFIVALNAEQFGSGEHCFDTITISYNGRSAQAQIVDRCAECPYGAIDLTTGLFSYIAPNADGVFYATWNFGSGNTETTTSTSSTHTPSTSTSTWTPESTSWSSTSTWSSSSSSSSSTSTWSSSSSTSTSSSSSTTSSSISSSASATASATTGVDAGGFLDELNYGLLQLGGLIADALQVNVDSTESS